MAQIAVLTGDLIASSALTQKQRDVFELAFRNAAEQLEDWSGRNTFTSSRGDSWQIVVQPPSRALRAALYIRAWLRRRGREYATRVSIATGMDDIPKDQNLNLATGPVFVTSGRGLERLSRNAQMIHAEEGAMGAATRLADHISQGWTPAQASILTEMLHPWETTQKEVADRLGKSQQAVQQSLAGAGYHALSQALDLIEAAP